MIIFKTNKCLSFESKKKQRKLLKCFLNIKQILFEVILMRVGHLTVYTSNKPKGESHFYERLLVQLCDIIAPLVLILQTSIRK